MSAVAQAPARAPRRRAPEAPAAPAAARQADHRIHFSPRRLSAGGLVSLLVLGALLGGIVALNVAALRASMQASRLSASAQALQQQNRGLTAEVASLTASLRIDHRARALGMVPPTPGRSDTLRLSGSHRARPAPVHHLTAPVHHPTGSFAR